MLSFFVLSQIVIRTARTRPGAHSQNAIPAVNPLQSALPKNARVTPLQSALPNSLDLKPFRIRTYKKRWGERGKLLTGICPAQLRVASPNSQNGPQTGSVLPASPTTDGRVACESSTSAQSIRATKKIAPLV